MRIDVATLFPEMFESLKCGVIGKAMERGLISVNAVNIREYTADKHGKCDDTPFGGGAGMVMTPKTLDQATVLRLAKCERLLILCGNYEGVDQRVIDEDIDEEISIGDYVLTGGELPAMVLINACARYVKGVLGSEQSTDEESFSDGLLEYPQYTRPREYLGREVPEVLLSGDHAAIAKWRREKQLEITRERRPDLLEKK